MIVHSEFKMEVKQADDEILELAHLLELTHQTAEEKLEIVRPFFNGMNLYCNETFLKLEKDTELFPIPLSSIKCVEYPEHSDTLFILL